MFGYVAPLKSELKVRELALYNAYYCGVCRMIGREFGQLPRLALSYDSAFLGILIAGVNGDMPCTPKRCALKPMKGKRPVAPESEALCYAADLNLALSYYKCRDDWRDEKKPSALVGGAAFRKAALQVERRRPRLFAAIREGIDALSSLEKQRCDVLDAPADVFARMMRDALLDAPVPERERTILSSLAYHIGRWIYLADAWEDRERDRRSGAYNPFNITGADEARASFLLNYSLSEAIGAYELLDMKGNEGLVSNILCDGCAAKTRSLFKATPSGKRQAIPRAQEQDGKGRRNG